MVRNRLATLFLVAGFLAASLAVFPDRDARGSFQYFFVITLGYGHLIGGLVFSWRKLSGSVPYGVPSWPLGILVITLIVSAFLGYGRVVASSPVFFFAMLGISSWHIFENDLGLARSYRSGFRSLPIPRTAEHHMISIGMTGAVAALSWATFPGRELEAATMGSWLSGTTNLPGRIIVGAIGILLLLRRRASPVGGLGTLLVLGMAVLPERIEDARWFGFSEVFSAVTLYHLVGWLIFFLDRARVSGSTSIRWKLLAVHAPPAALCGLVYSLAAPDSDLAFWILSPAVYLFWSVLHVIQTAFVRGVEPRPA